MGIRNEDYWAYENGLIGPAAEERKREELLGRVSKLEKAVASLLHRVQQLEDAQDSRDEVESGEHDF